MKTSAPADKGWHMNFVFLFQIQGSNSLFWWTKKSAEEVPSEENFDLRQ